MFEAPLFLNAVNMVVGGALISSPIIIHLINRMRFKRQPWAAMEFLLKSQKRNRRRLIIEQLILLALRILLVLLAGLLLARFLGFSFAGFLQPQSTVHVVILDDRLSMNDQWKDEDGGVKTSFQVAKQLIEKEIAKPASQGRAHNRLVLFRLSDLTLSTPPAPFDQRLNDDSLRELNQFLNRMEECSLLHLDLTKGVKAAEDLLEKNVADQGILYIVSDFRQRHWGGPEAEGLLKALDHLAKGKDQQAKNRVKINLIDVAHPFRSETQRTALYHDNLAVVEVRPESRVVAEQMPVTFTVTVANYSPSERKNVRVSVFVNGQERLESSVPLPSVLPGHTTGTFEVPSFGQLGFNQVAAKLENEEAGLQADNIRYAVVEVRRQVPILVIDGDLTGGDKPGGDTFHLKTLFTAARGFEVQRGGINELKRPDLEKYPSIYLLNVRDIRDPASLKNLENYVKGGGSVAFFLGPQVDPEFYNKELYKDGKGVFPAPLADRPTKELSEEEKQQKLLRNLTDPQFQLFWRSDTHPLTAEAYKVRTAFKFLSIDRYFPVPRPRWNRESNRVEELATLPNDRPLSDYDNPARDILNALPVDDPKYGNGKYRAGLERHRNSIREALGGKALYVLANALDNLLRDAGKPDDPERPNLREFWDLTDPQIQDLRTRVERFKETVQYGDPLILASRYGKGRVVAFLTTAGRKWNDWAGGSPASVTYPVVMLELQKFLSSVDTETDKIVGTPLEIEVDSSRYETTMRRYFQPEAREEQAGAPAGNQPQPANAGLKDLGVQTGTVQGGRVNFVFDEARKPGVYLFDLTQRPDVGAEGKAETRAFAFNLDTTNESDLRRATRDELERVAAGVIVHRPESQALREQLNDRQTDLSESAWFFLVFLIVLVVEQALAVHLSFHLKGNEALPPAQVVQPRATAA
jgi:hypothetical protein